MMVLAAMVVGSSLVFLTSKMFLGLTDLSERWLEVRLRANSVREHGYEVLGRRMFVKEGRSIIIRIRTSSRFMKKVIGVSVHRKWSSLFMQWPVLNN
jgi:hypothetical protein